MDAARTEEHVELLRRNGLRATGQRLVILAALERLGHATMEQLLEATQAELPNLQLSTVYRSVETLTAHSIVSHTHLTGPTPTYQLTAPLFERITIQRDARYGPGGAFTIEVAGERGGGPGYVRAAELDGEPLAGPTLTHAQFRAGRRLVLQVGPEPR